MIKFIYLFLAFFCCNLYADPGCEGGVCRTLDYQSEFCLDQKDGAEELLTYLNSPSGLVEFFSSACGEFPLMDEKTERENVDELLGDLFQGSQKETFIKSYPDPRKQFNAAYLLRQIHIKEKTIDEVIKGHSSLENTTKTRSSEIDFAKKMFQQMEQEVLKIKKGKVSEYRDSLREIEHKQKILLTLYPWANRSDDHPLPSLTDLKRMRGKTVALADCLLQNQCSLNGKEVKEEISSLASINLPDSNPMDQWMKCKHEHYSLKEDTEGEMSFLSALNLMREEFDNKFETIIDGPIFSGVKAFVSPDKQEEIQLLDAEKNEQDGPLVNKFKECLGEDHLNRNYRKCLTYSLMMERIPDKKRVGSVPSEEIFQQEFEQAFGTKAENGLSLFQKFAPQALRSEEEQLQNVSFSTQSEIINIAKKCENDMKLPKDFASFFLDMELYSEYSELSENELIKVRESYNNYLVHFQKIKSVSELNNMALNDLLRFYKLSETRASEAFLSNQGNCQTQTRLLIEAFRQSQIKIDPPKRLGVQLFHDHVRAVIVDTSTGETIDLFNGNKGVANPGAPIFDPSYMCWAYLKKRDLAGDPRPFLIAGVMNESEASNSDGISDQMPSDFEWGNFSTVFYAGPATSPLFHDNASITPGGVDHFWQGDQSPSVKEMPLFEFTICPPNEFLSLKNVQDISNYLNKSKIFSKKSSKTQGFSTVKVCVDGPQMLQEVRSFPSAVGQANYLTKKATERVEKIYEGFDRKIFRPFLKDPTSLDLEQLEKFMGTENGQISQLLNRLNGISVLVDDNGMEEIRFGSKKLQDLFKQYEEFLTKIKGNKQNFFDSILSVQSKSGQKKDDAQIKRGIFNLVKSIENFELGGFLHREMSFDPIELNIDSGINVGELTVSPPQITPTQETKEQCENGEKSVRQGVFEVYCSRLAIVPEGEVAVDIEFNTILFATENMKLPQTRSLVRSGFSDRNPEVALQYFDRETTSLSSKEKSRLAGEILEELLETKGNENFASGLISRMEQSEEFLTKLAITALEGNFQNISLAILNHPNYKNYFLKNVTIKQLLLDFAEFQYQYSNSYSNIEKFLRLLYEIDPNALAGKKMNFNLFQGNRITAQNADGPLISLLEFLRNQAKATIETDEHQIFDYRMASAKRIDLAISLGGLPAGTIKEDFCSKVILRGEDDLTKSCFRDQPQNLDDKLFLTQFVREAKEGRISQGMETLKDTEVFRELISSDLTKEQFLKIYSLLNNDEIKKLHVRLKVQAAKLGLLDLIKEIKNKVR